MGEANLQIDRAGCGDQQRPEPVASDSQLQVTFADVADFGLLGLNKSAQLQKQAAAHIGSQKRVGTDCCQDEPSPVITSTALFRQLVRQLDEAVSKTFISNGILNVPIMLWQSVW